MKKVLLIFLSVCFLLVGGTVALLKTDRDIIKYDGRIYSNITELDWFEREGSRFSKGDKIGEIKRISKSTILMGNFSATNLPKGTVLFNTDGTKEGKPLIILAESASGKILYYRWLPKE